MNNTPFRQSSNSDQGIDITQTSTTVCENCGKEAFQQAFILRKISALLSPTGKAGFVPVPVFVCLSCHHINDDFLPNELRKPKLVS